MCSALSRTMIRCTRCSPRRGFWHLDELHRVATGKNVRVAAIDSGAELDHPDLRGRIAIERNFVDAREAVAELHGTAVAGIIAARAGNGVGIVGVAPEAQLMALRACWQSPADANATLCSTFTLAKALQFAIDNKARVINLSLGGPRDRLIERLVAAAVARGIVVVVAADPRIGDGGFPASLAGVLAVADEDMQGFARDGLPRARTRHSGLRFRGSAGGSWAGLPMPRRRSADSSPCSSTSRRSRICNRFAKR
jgi:subtilisin family serine protease